MQALDLNSQEEDFPDLNSYSEFLRGHGVPRGRESRTLSLRVSRNGGRGGGGSGGGGGSRCAGGSRGGDGNRGASSNSGGAGRATRSLFLGSLPEGGIGSRGRGGGRGGGRGSRPRTTSAGAAMAFKGDNVVDIDEENGNDGAKAVEVIFPGSKVFGCTHPLLHCYAILMWYICEICVLHGW